MPEELTWPQAIQKVLSSSPNPLHYSEITERIISDGLRHNLGATPAATVIALISSSIKSKGSGSPYVRTAKGTYMLVQSKGMLIPSETTASNPAASIPDEEEQYDIVTSFGMFWQRGEVEWVRTPKLLGKQKNGTISVDFSQQQGVYLLYDGREVIYVGRTTDGLGSRLYNHTIHRLSARWDRFSWFGLRPVSDEGALGQLPKDLIGKTRIPALEAILIEALEPRQNRKRGDDLERVEYVQDKDPEIRQRRLKAEFAQIISKA